MGKRIYPLNRIKYWYGYDVDDVCRLYSKHKLHPKTVLEWKKQGLQAIDNRNPILFYGFCLIKFLGKMNESNKCKTAFDEIFCMKCKEGKRPLKRQIQLIPENRTFLKVKAVCQTCKNQMFKNYKLDDLQKVKRTFAVVEVLELYDYEIPPLKTPFFVQAKDDKKECEKEPIQPDLFL
ncbi:MAG: Helix-turn-helix domain protein [Rickettsiaceae bacterium]|jgi:hypothetical protein|nr:Helix-turn-helix domain protein [Rickettsiaceae bacterium]